MAHRLGGYFRTPRTVRLERDFAEMKALKDESTILDFQADGDPPDDYRILFHGKTLVPAPGGGVQIGMNQEARITIGIDYPRAAPGIKWMSPIVHPNIWGAGTVCLGAFWNSWTPCFHLTELVEILWDMARLAILNPHSAGTSGRDEPVVWADLAREFGFPVDRRPLRDRRLGHDQGSSVLRPQGAAQDVLWLDDEDAGCAKKK